MHLNQIDLNLFVVLDAIYREGNITRAGHQLNLTQPAISHSLRRLRELLRDPLFVRQGPNMVPTPFTRTIIGQVRQALQILEVNLHENQHFDPVHTRRTFSLGLRDSSEAIVLPALLGRLEEAAPGISLASVRVNRRDLEAELANGSIDLAMDIPLSLGEDIRQKWIFRDRLVVVARSGHPRVSSTLDLDTYLSETHIMVSLRRSGPGLEDTELIRLGKRRRIGVRCQHFFEACRLVSQTELLLTMPERYALLLNTQFGNRLYPFPARVPFLDVHLYWHESAENDAANRWLRTEIERAFAEQLAVTG
ncbi:MAG TPA: LysR family transcriptional regulator [Terriglobales bacterium]|nr:LysR family transcriptional regulator [Terriglobales bacterium]